MINKRNKTLKVRKRKKPPSGTLVSGSIFVSLKTVVHYFVLNSREKNSFLMDANIHVIAYVFGNIRKFLHRHEPTRADPSRPEECRRLFRSAGREHLAICTITFECMFFFFVNYRKLLNKLFCCWKSFWSERQYPTVHCVRWTNATTYQMEMPRFVNYS